jgi:CRP-like cAMP-binding protein
MSETGHNRLCSQPQSQPILAAARENNHAENNIDRQRGDNWCELSRRTLDILVTVKVVPGTEQRTNRLLTLLSDDDYERLRPHFSISKLSYRKVLYDARREIRNVYFPIDGVASLVLEMGNGAAVEVGTIGSEGMVGIPIVLGDRHAPSTVYVQVPGRALRMDARVFHQEVKRSPTLHAVLLRYIHALFNQVAQSAACAHLHKVEQRCCRWLLMTRDRMPSDEFLLTQEFLGMMLGVRRPSVSLTMTDLQKAGLIRYSRGRVNILNRNGLQKRACECYKISKLEFDRLLGDSPTKPKVGKARRLVSEIG